MNATSNSTAANPNPETRAQAQAQRINRLIGEMAYMGGAGIARLDDKSSPEAMLEKAADAIEQIQKRLADVSTRHQIQEKELRELTTVLQCGKTFFNYIGVTK